MELDLLGLAASHQAGAVWYVKSSTSEGPSQR